MDESESKIITINFLTVVCGYDSDKLYHHIIKDCLVELYIIPFKNESNSVKICNLNHDFQIFLKNTKNEVTNNPLCFYFFVLEECSIIESVQIRVVLFLSK